MRRLCWVLVSSIACGETIEPSPYPPCPECVALVGGSIFDGAQVRAGTLVLRGRQIDRLIFEEAPPEVGTRVELDGRTILPGLIDLHVHSYFPPTTPGFDPISGLARLQIEALLMNGVTAYLDLGAPPEAVFPDRQASLRNLSYPRLFTAGPMMTATDGHPCDAFGTSPACRFVDATSADRIVEEIVSLGPDALKLIIEPGWRMPLPTVDAGTIATVVAAASTRRLPLYVHVTRVEDLHAALDAGARRFAHLPFRELMTEADAQRLAQLDVLVIPTIMFVDSLDRIGRGALEELTDPALVDDVHPTVLADLADATRVADYTQAGAMADVAEALAIARANLALLVTHRVRIGAGTDAGNVANFHGRSLRKELVHYVAAGMTPAEAIATATNVAADALGRADLGRIAPGAEADLIAVDGDPLSDLSALGRVDRVWKGGAEVDLSALGP